jgi:kynurenine formamidase
MWAGGPLPRQMGYADDTVVLHLQSATHWDSLCHIFHRGRMYNGYPADEFTANGTARNGSEVLKAKLVGRGVLLDIPRAKGVRWLDDGYAITRRPRGAAEMGKVDGRDGRHHPAADGPDGALLRGGLGHYAGGDAPGLSFFTIPWLAKRNIAAVASDTWGCEVRPNELPDSFQPFHIPALVYMGLLIGEMFNLEELAEACADDGATRCSSRRRRCAFTGTAGAPPGPVAIR